MICAQTRIARETTPGTPIQGKRRRAGRSTNTACAQRRLLRAARLSLTLVTLPLARSLAAQASGVHVVAVDTTPCSNCEINSRTVVALTLVRARQGFPAPPNAVVLDHRGRYWVLSGSRPPEVFDSRGHLVASVPQAADPAARFRLPIDLSETEKDSLVVLDLAAQKAFILTPAALVARSVDLPGPMYHIFIENWPDSVVANGIVHSSEAFGWSFHQLSFDGKRAAIKNSFGPDSGELRAGQQLKLIKAMAQARNGDFWTADVGQYRVQKWNATGELLQTLVRVAPWFPPGFASAGGAAAPPAPAISAIREDSLGLLWIFVRVAAPTWREGWPPVRRGIHEVPVSSVRMEKLFQTVVEVIDPANGKLIAQSRLGSWITSALPGRRGAASELGADGRRRIRIVQFELTGYHAPNRGSSP